MPGFQPPKNGRTPDLRRSGGFPWWRLGTPNPNHPRAGSSGISHYSSGFTQFRVSRNPWSEGGHRYSGWVGLLSAGGCSCLIAQPRVEPPGGGPVSNAILVFVVRIVWPTGCFRVVVVLVLAASLVVPAGSVAAQGGFSDLDEAGPHRAGVEELAERGVLEGTLCAPEEFCPGEPLARWVMAVWLVRVLDGTDPVGSGSRFADVGSDEWWAPYVERLAVLGVTTGCATGPARYCPHDSVTRAQMATFLTRAFDLGAAPSFGFVDTEGNTHAASIDALAAAGVTAGCAAGPARYCPADSVTRGSDGHVPHPGRQHRSVVGDPRFGGAAVCDRSLPSNDLLQSFGDRLRCR